MNGGRQRWDAVSRAGTVPRLACQVIFATGLQGWSLKGSGTDWGVEALAEAPRAGEPLGQPCLGRRRGQGGCCWGTPAWVTGVASGNKLAPELV